MKKTWNISKDYTNSNVLHEGHLLLKLSSIGTLSHQPMGSGICTSFNRIVSTLRRSQFKSKYKQFIDSVDSNFKNKAAKTARCLSVYEINKLTRKNLLLLNAEHYERSKE